jgi:hypothetical protein
VDQREFQKQLKALSEAQEGKFGYPFLSLRSIGEAFGLSVEQLTRHVIAEREAGRVVMNPIDEKTEENLPATLTVLHLNDPDGTVRAYVSLALKP